MKKDTVEVASPWTVNVEIVVSSGRDGEEVFRQSIFTMKGGTRELVNSFAKRFDLSVFSLCHLCDSDYILLLSGGFQLYLHLHGSANGSHSEEFRAFLEGLWNALRVEILERAGGPTNYGSLQYDGRIRVIRELFLVGVVADEECVRKELLNSVKAVCHDFVSNLNDDNICKITADDKSFLLERTPDNALNYYDYFSDTDIDSPLDEIKVNLMAYLCGDLMEEFESTAGMQELLKALEHEF